MKSSISVAVYSGRGANYHAPARKLREAGFRVTSIRQDDLTLDRLRQFHVLFLSGGWYFFDKNISQAIVAFVKGGGGCVGSCAGSYLVAGGIPIIPGRVLRSNMRGRLYIEPQNGAHPILRGVVQPCQRHKARKWEPIAMSHMGGPLIFPRNRKHIVASYDWEGKIGALVAANVGKGRAVAIASHPELPLAPLARHDQAHRTDHLYQGPIALILSNAIRWAARR